MKTLLPQFTAFTFLLALVQTFLFVVIALSLLRGVRLLKKPYSGMDHPDAILNAVLLLGTMIISWSNIPGLCQASRFYSDGNVILYRDLILYSGKTFLLILSAIVLFIGQNLIVMRLATRADDQVLTLPVSLLLGVIAVSCTYLYWFLVKSAIDDITPKIINYI